jgi:hypothetical protein
MLIRKSELCVRQAGQIRLTAEVTDVGCEHLAAETSFARLLIVDKSNARLPRQLALIPRQSSLGRRGTFNWSSMLILLVSVAEG